MVDCQQRMRVQSVMQPTEVKLPRRCHSADLTRLLAFCPVVNGMTCMRWLWADAAVPAPAQPACVPVSGRWIPAPCPPFLVPGPPMWAGPNAPAPPAPRPFLPAPISPSPPVQHPVPSQNLPSAYLTNPEPASSPAAAYQPAHPIAEPAQPAAPMAEAASRAASPRLASMPVPTARLLAPTFIITPPHPEGLARLQQHRERDGISRIPVNKARGQSVFTPAPTEEELARLRAVVDQRRAVKGLLEECGSADQTLTPSAAQRKAVVTPSPVRPDPLSDSPAAVLWSCRQPWFAQRTQLRSIYTQLPPSAELLSLHH